MDQTTITAEVRRLLVREPQAANAPVIADTKVTELTLRGGQRLWELLRASDPTFCRRRKALTSNTNVFALPSGVQTINRVLNMQGNAGTITGAANDGSGLIRITEAAHGYSAGDILVVQDIVGTTEANNTWKLQTGQISAIADNGSGLCRVTHTAHGYSTSDEITISNVEGTTEANDEWTITKIDANTYDLQGSTFSNTYTSGGDVIAANNYVLTGSTFSNAWVSGGISWKEKNSFLKIDNWYGRGMNIVIDDVNHSYDIIIDYIATFSAITDLPTDFHDALVSFCVLHLITIPSRKSDHFDHYSHILRLHSENWKATIERIQAFQMVSSGPKDIPMEIDWSYM